MRPLAPATKTDDPEQLLRHLWGHRPTHRRLLHKWTLSQTNLHPSLRLLASKYVTVNLNIGFCLAWGPTSECYAGFRCPFVSGSSACDRVHIKKVILPLVCTRDCRAGKIETFCPCAYDKPPLCPIKSVSCPSIFNLAFSTSMKRRPSPRTAVQLTLSGRCMWQRHTWIDENA